MRWLLTAATVLLIVSACGDDDPDGATTPTLTSERPTVTSAPSATATTMPSITATPSPRPTSTDPNAIELWRGPDAPFPDDMAIYIEPGCYGCDGVRFGLTRLYRDPTGEIRSETVIGGSGGEPFVLPNWMSAEHPGIKGLDVSADGSAIVVGLCIQQSCGAGGISTWHPDSITAVLRSDDGGITWREIARRGPALSVIGLLGNDQVLTVNYPTEIPIGKSEFRLLPSGELVEPPIVVRLDNPPLVASGRILWRAEDGGLLLNDGTEFIPAPDAEYAFVGRVDGENDSLDAGTLTVLWHIGTAGELSTYEINDGAATLSQTLFSPTSLYAHVWKPGDATVLITIHLLSLGPSSLFSLPGLLNTATGEYRLIEEGFLTADGEPSRYGRGYVRALREGPFARVVDTGSCLNVRAEPSLAAQVLDCMADGVLLRDFGEVSEADGVTWVRVSTPAGVEGWASARFLER